MDQHAWASMFQSLTKAYGKPYDPDLAEVFFKALEDLPNRAVNNALDQTIRDQKHFPRPAEVRMRAVAIRAAELRPIGAALAEGPAMTAEETAEFLKQLAATKVKIFGRRL